MQDLLSLDSLHFRPEPGVITVQSFRMRGALLGANLNSALTRSESLYKKPSEKGSSQICQVPDEKTGDANRNSKGRSSFHCDILLK